MFARLRMNLKLERDEMKFYLEFKILAFLNVTQVTAKHKEFSISQFETTEQLTTLCRCQSKRVSQMFFSPNAVQLKCFMKDHPWKIIRK